MQRSQPIFIHVPLKFFLPDNLNIPRCVIFFYLRGFIFTFKSPRLESFGFFLSLSLHRYRQYVMCHCVVKSVQPKSRQPSAPQADSFSGYVSVHLSGFCRQRSNLIKRNFDPITVKPTNYNVTHISNSCTKQASPLLKVKLAKKKFTYAARALTNNIRKNSNYAYRL